MYNVIGIDPGEAVGYAVFEVHPDKPEDTKLIWIGQGRHTSFEQEFIDLINKYEPRVVVAEDYIVYSHKLKAHRNSRMNTSRMLGKIEALSKVFNYEVELQPASILTVAQKWTRRPLPKNHSISHQFSALNHARFYLIKNKLDLNELAREQKEKNNGNS